MPLALTAAVAASTNQRMARHDQRPLKRDMVCPSCKKDRCNECINVSLILGGRKEICQCERKNHSGEPRDKQVRDPFTGTVVSTGAVIGFDGDVTIKRAKIVGEDELDE